MHGQLSCEKCGASEVRRYNKNDQGNPSDYVRWMCRPCISMTALVASMRKRLWRAQKSARLQAVDPSTRPVKLVLKAAWNAARRYKLPSTLTRKEWQSAVSFFSNRCAYCRSSWDEVEHATPLFRGGGTTVANCLPVCSYCNDEKRFHSLEELLEKDLWPHLSAHLEHALGWLKQNGRK